MALGIVHEVASNIDTKGHFPQLTDLVSLRHWLYASNKRKLFIFDEANVHLPSRRAMSGKNVEIVRLLGEVSKAHARMIVIAQELLRVDKEFLNPTWVRGVFIKRSLKKAQLISHMVPKQYVFHGIPSTSIKFDPYAVAPFTEKSKNPTLQFKDKSLEMLWDYTNDTRKSEVCKIHNIHRIQFDRILKRYLQRTLPMFEKIDVLTENDAIKACAIYRNGGSLSDIRTVFNLSHQEEAKRLLIQGIGELLKRQGEGHLIANPSV